MMRAKRVMVNAWRTAAIAVVALSALSAASAQNPNLVQDPSFETTISNNDYGNPPTTWFAGQFLVVGPGKSSLGVLTL
jgi:ornithine cyclodeaminase/alanine dehydrogenase-like protein (mu-crystallin family)